MEVLNRFAWTAVAFSAFSYWYSEAPSVSVSQAVQATAAPKPVSVEISKSELAVKITNRPKLSKAPAAGSGSDLASRERLTKSTTTYRSPARLERVKYTPPDNGAVIIGERRRAAEFQNKENSFTKAVTEARLDRITQDVTRIHYPPETSTFDLPKAIYWNEVGQELYGDTERLGIGAGAEMVSLWDDYTGVRLGANIQNSVLGGFGFIKGDIITTIGGHEVRSIDDIGRLLKESGDKPVAVSYINSLVKDGGIITTYIAVRERN